jgi:GAF domain-containing protein
VKPDVKEGQGPAGIALRTGIPYVGNDIQADDKNYFWLQAMLATGARAMVVFPLRRGGEVVGSLHLYAAEKNWFDEELIALIGELVANISFALDNFERERVRQRTEAGRALPQHLRVAALQRKDRHGNEIHARPDELRDEQRMGIRGGQARASEGTRCPPPIP